MIRLCGGCAFRIGTEANRQVHTRIMAEICALINHNFLCHSNIQDDGWGPLIEGTKPRLCVGWVNRILELHKDGTLERLTDAEKRALVEALKLLRHTERQCPSDTEIAFVIGKVHQLTGHRLVDLIRRERQPPVFEMSTVSLLDRERQPPTHRETVE